MLITFRVWVCSLSYDNTKCQFAEKFKEVGSDSSELMNYNSKPNERQKYDKKHSCSDNKTAGGSVCW